MKQTLLLSLLLATFLSAFAQPNQWTWASGDIRPEQSGLYGLKGVAEFSNRPGARQNPVNWSDASGNFWLFGGYGIAQNRTGYLSDLWKYNPSTNLWTWISGDPIPDQPTVSGIKGVAAADNKPGGRTEATAWTDASGNLWLFGGQGYAASGSGKLNDLWKYSLSTNQWTWMSGDVIPGNPGVYGVRGKADAANNPGARSGAAGGMDAAGNFWLFGGTGGAGPTSGQLNDLWKYNLSSGQWTWMSGDNLPNQSSVYGSREVAGAASKPGGRSNAAAWSTASGDFWLFGGTTFYGGNPSAISSVNDLWKYTISSGLWTWMGGDTIPYTKGVYGTRGVAAAGNRPGSRNYAVALTDASGKLLLYGGQGQGNTGSGSGVGFFNDLWEYSPLSARWTWLTGDSLNNQYGVYGSKGLASPFNKPGGRFGHVGWLDPSGSLWIFGGVTLGSSFSTLGIFNDMWRYTLTGTPVSGMINSFTGHRESQTVALNWTTSPDQNIHSFVVERYTGNAVYDSIGHVAATGTLSSAVHYSFVDKAPLPGTNFYRIRQLDRAGASTYTPVAQVSMELYATQFSVVQNPVQGALQLNVQLPEPQKLTLEVRDMRGQLMLKQEQQGYQGRAVYAVPADRLAKGTYLIRLTTGNQTSTKTFIKQ